MGVRTRQAKTTNGWTEPCTTRGALVAKAPQAAALVPHAGALPPNVLRPWFAIEPTNHDVFVGPTALSTGIPVDRKLAGRRDENRGRTRRAFVGSWRVRLNRPGTKHRCCQK